jgi:hypothetical protein
MNKLFHLILEGTVACIRQNMKKNLLFNYKVGLLFSLSKYKKIIPISPPGGGRNITI